MLKLEINSETDIDSLSTYENQLLMSSDRKIFLVKDIKIIEEDKVIKHTFKKDETVKTKFVTCTIHSYNRKGRFVGYHTSTDVLRNLVKYFNLHEMRQRFFQVEEELKAMVEFKKEQDGQKDS